ncbi:MAG: entry exclusion 1 domain-containing protein [Pseudomonadota bacterium]
MAKVGAQRAAELTGKSKSTIQRAMNSGKLSYELDNNNRRTIDVSELERVFGLKAPTAEKQQTSSVEDELQKAADLLEMERLKMRIKMLEGQLEQLQTNFEDMQAQRDQWQKQAQQILITSQYSQKQAEDYKAELKAREERAQKRKEQILAERMKKMKEKSENQNQKKDETSNSSASDESSSGFQGLFQKIRGSKAA